ncbi:MAG: 50S ribosomal protein L24 [Elusimicrobiota bacterium]
MKAKIQKKDTVLILSGKEKGKKGEVVKIDAAKQRVWIAKCNLVTKHAKPTQTEPGGLQKKEAPIHLSNVMLVCPKCERAIRPKCDKLNDGQRVRVCRNEDCGEVIL